MFQDYECLGISAKSQSNSNIHTLAYMLHSTVSHLISFRIDGVDRWCCYHCCCCCCRWYSSYGLSSLILKDSGFYCFCIVSFISISYYYMCRTLVSFFLLRLILILIRPYFISVRWRNTASTSLTWRLWFIANFSRNINLNSIDMQNGS